MELTLRPHQAGMILPVLLQPKAARDEIVGPSQGRLKIRLTAPPIEDRANQALVAFLAKRLKVARSRVIILAGRKSRQKDVLIEGAEPADLLRLWPEEPDEK